MRNAEDAARDALNAAATLLEEAGLVALIRDLQREVWAINLARYEPDELGDTPKTLGIQCSENFSTRALRRHRGDDLEWENRWSVEGLMLSTPRGTLMFEIAGVRIVCMKVPMLQGRAPRWDRLKDWDHESQIRQEIAAENSRVLGGYATPDPGQGELPIAFSKPRSAPGLVRDYMYVWGADPEAPVTSGWLTVPALGVQPFAAIRQLWRDEDDDLPRGSRVSQRDPDGPSYDAKPAVQPNLTIKPRPATEGEA